jgi:hypothetical protein
VLIGYADLAALGGTTAFLLLCVFAIVNVLGVVFLPLSSQSAVGTRVR